MSYSIVVPVYLNSESLPEVLLRLESINATLKRSLEVVFVVDGSPDDSLLVLKSLLPKSQFQARLLSHSRNFGSFEAIRTGFRAAQGEFVAIMAADLQEPEDLTIRFFKELAGGSVDVVLGVRESRRDPFFTRFASNLFWWLYRRFVQKSMPSGGIDVFGVNQTVAKNLVSMSESHSSLVGQLLWVGYRRTEIRYSRLARAYGKSAWSFSKKLRYMSDSLFSFTSLPISIILLMGAVGTLLSAVLSLAIFVTWFFGGIEVAGYTAQMLVQLLSTGSLLFALGVVGTYVWRTYENSKQRPLSIVMSDDSF